MCEVTRPSVYHVIERHWVCVCVCVWCLFELPVLHENYRDRDRDVEKKCVQETDRRRERESAAIYYAAHFRNFSKNGNLFMCTRLRSMRAYKNVRTHEKLRWQVHKMMV